MVGEGSILRDFERLRGFEEIDKGCWRFPLACQWLDQDTNLCTHYDERPETCKEFPRKGSPLPKECKYYE